MHRDFKLVERHGPLADPRLTHLRDALRSTWEVPTDTFVTLDLPRMLTKLAQPPRRAD